LVDRGQRVDQRSNDVRLLAKRRISLLARVLARVERLQRLRRHRIILVFGSFRSRSELIADNRLLSGKVPHQYFALRSFENGLLKKEKW